MLEAVERTKAELEAKGVELAAIRADFEEKKKEVGVFVWVGGWAGGVLVVVAWGVGAGLLVAGQGRHPGL